MESKTLFTFKDKYGDISTLTLDKYVAESLHRQLEDVHKWIQNIYDEVAYNTTYQSRRSIGDFIRDSAWRIFLAEPPPDDF